MNAFLIACFVVVAVGSGLAGYFQGREDERRRR